MAKVNYQDRCILNGTEAGWRFFERDRQVNKDRDDRITTFQIVTFQAEAWSNRQRFRSRVDVMEVRDNVLDRYQQLTSKLFTNQVVSTKKAQHFLVSTKLHESIVENIIHGCPFFRA